MKHPESLLLPVMMLLDYFLTIATAVGYEKGYSRIFAADNYELNPIWQKDVKSKKWFNPKALLGSILVSTVVVLSFEFGRWSKDIVHGALGYLFVVYAMILGRHAGNLLLIRHLRRNPDAVSGQVRLSHRFQLHQALFQMLAVAFPVFLIAIFSPHPFVLGGALGMITFFITVIVWIRKERRESIRNVTGFGPSASH